jgi:hypothetical protein
VALVHACVRVCWSSHAAGRRLGANRVEAKSLDSFFPTLRSLPHPCPSPTLKISIALPRRGSGRWWQLTGGSRSRHGSCRRPLRTSPCASPRGAGWDFCRLPGWASVSPGQAMDGDLDASELGGEGGARAAVGRHSPHHMLRCRQGCAAATLDGTSAPSRAESSTSTQQIWQGLRPASPVSYTHTSWPCILLGWTIWASEGRYWFALEGKPWAILPDFMALLVRNTICANPRCWCTIVYMVISHWSIILNCPTPL